MGQCVQGLVDSQLVQLFIKEHAATTWEKVLNITTLPLPAGERATDDVTTIDDLFKKEVAGGVISYAPLEIEGLYTTTGAGQTQRVKLTKYFNEGTCIDWLILLPDAEKTSYDGCGTIASLAPVREATKKNRVKLKLPISGEVKERQDGENVLVPTDIITLPTV
nr:phage tail tube protein [uncultured Acinetobacter sp.]